MSAPWSAKWSRRINRFAWLSSASVAYYMVFYGTFSGDHILLPIRRWRKRTLARFTGTTYDEDADIARVDAEMRDRIADRAARRADPRATEINRQQAQLVLDS